MHAAAWPKVLAFTFCRVVIFKRTLQCSVTGYFVTENLPEEIQCHVSTFGMCTLLLWSCNFKVPLVNSVCVLGFLHNADFLAMGTRLGTSSLHPLAVS